MNVYEHWEEGRESCPILFAWNAINDREHDRRSKRVCHVTGYRLSVIVELCVTMKSSSCHNLSHRCDLDCRIFSSNITIGLVLPYSKMDVQFSLKSGLGGKHSPQYKEHLLRNFDVEGLSNYIHETLILYSYLKMYSWFAKKTVWGMARRVSKCIPPSCGAAYRPYSTARPRRYTSRLCQI